MAVQVTRLPARPAMAALMTVFLLIGTWPASGEPVFDGDRDGVPDERDLCLFTAMGETVMVNGCAPTGDNDQDGVDDSLDRCPQSPIGAVIDHEGCSLDQDIDGIADGIDRCPGTPLGYMVDAIGCTSGQMPMAVAARPTPMIPVLPSAPARPPVVASPPSASPISEGMPTDAPVPTTMGTPVAAQQPEPAPAVPSAPAPITAAPGSKTQQIGSNAMRIEFRPYSALLGDEAQASLHTFAARALPVLGQFPRVRVVVTGATSESETGSAAHRLGIGRALTIKAFLRSLGIDKDRIDTPEGAEQRPDTSGSADIRLINS